MSAPLGQYRRLLAAYLWPQWPWVVVLAMLLSAGIGLQILNLQILRFFIDTARAGGALGILIGTALLFLGVALAGQVVSVVETYVAENVGLVATNRLRADLMLHCLRLDPSFHNARTPGELIERIDLPGVVWHAFSTHIGHKRPAGPHLIVEAAQRTESAFTGQRVGTAAAWAWPH